MCFIKQRNQGCNAVVVSVGLLGDEDNERLVRFALAAGRPTEQWHGLQNRQLRSVADAEGWLAAQFDGTLMRHIVETLAVPSNRDAKVLCPQPPFKLKMSLSTAEYFTRTS